MPPFVKSKKVSDIEDAPDNFNHEVGILVMAKKTRLSFEELNLMTLQDFMDYIDIYVGEIETTREATQDDIDNFYNYL